MSGIRVVELSLREAAESMFEWEGEKVTANLIRVRLAPTFAVHGSILVEGRIGGVRLRTNDQGRVSIQFSVGIAEFEFYDGENNFRRYDHPDEPSWMGADVGDYQLTIARKIEEPEEDEYGLPKVI